MLSEVSQRKERQYEAPLICRMEKETIQRELINKTGTQSQIREGNFGCQRRSMGGRESQGVWDGHGHTAVPGASVRNPTRDKVMRQSSDGKANQTSGFLPGIS